MRWAETSAAWDWRPRVAGARMVLAETLLQPAFLHHFNKNCHFTTVPAFLGFCFNWILILVPTTRNPGTSLIPMGNDYKTFLGVPGSFFLHGWQCFFCSWAVPGGLWGHESGHVYDAPNIIFKPYRALPLYPRTEPHCRLSCQTSAKNIRLNSIAACAIMVQTLWMLPCMSRRVAPTLNATGPKKDASFLQKTMPCIHGPSLCVCVCLHSW